MCTSTNDSEKAKSRAFDSNVKASPDNGELLSGLLAQSRKDTSFTSQVNQSLDGLSARCLPLLRVLFEELDLLPWRCRDAEVSGPWHALNYPVCEEAMGLGVIWKIEVP